MRTYLLWLKLPPEYGGLHCTLMPRFEIRASPQEMKSEFDALFKLCEPMVLTFYQRALFGIAEDVPVSELVQTVALKNLHGDIVRTLNIHFNPRMLHRDWILNGYHPHVTDIDGHSFPVGGKTQARQIELIEFDGSDKKVRLNWQLECS